MNKNLIDGVEWDISTLERGFEAIEEVAKELNLNTYPSQIEIISSEQMVDAYSSNGLPVMYPHWSFGKSFSQTWNNYNKGSQGLALEIVINSSPCIAYLMENNSACNQLLVMAHALEGHNHFFKNNYLFRHWTDASSIVDYLIFARNYIEKIERQEGKYVVETFLDSCHALQDYGVNRYKKPSKPNVHEEKRRQEKLDEYKQSKVDEFYRFYKNEDVTTNKDDDVIDLEEPEENILYFCEKNSPTLKPWQRECIRITRKIAEYFYPNGQTKIMNEGCATVVHHKIMTRLHDLGKISDGNYLEFLSSHSSVVFQPDFDDKRYSNLNPYKLGQEIFREIERVCLTPTDEDLYWNKDFCNQDPKEMFLEVVKNYRDESFIRQFLTPNLIRKMKLFHLKDHNPREYVVTNIHNENGYIDIRETLASNSERETYVPTLEIVKHDKRDRKIYIKYTEYKGRKLANLDDMADHLKTIWGGEFSLCDNNNVNLMSSVQEQYNNEDDYYDFTGM